LKTEEQKNSRKQRKCWRKFAAKWWSRNGLQQFFK